MERDDPSAGDELLHAILEEVAATEEVEPLELPPLGAALDVDALQRLLESSSDDVVVTFAYAGYDVRVDGDGTVLIAEGAGAAE